MRRRQWTAKNPDAIESLLFAGAPTLINLVEEKLVHRPRLPHADWPLPIIYLIAADARHSPLIGFEDRLALTSRVAVCRIPPDDPPTSTKEALDRIVADLSSKVPGVARLRFPHYSLAVWLDALSSEEHDDTQADGVDRFIDSKLNELIRKRFPITSGAWDSADLAGQFPWYVRLLARPLPRLAMAAMRLMWRPPRWLAEQHEAKEGRPRSFRSLTRMYMANDGPSVGNYPTRQLLVDAFLEDLSRAYRRTTLFGRSRRRTSYPVLLADIPAARPAGAENIMLDLLERIALSRDAAGQQRRRPKPYRVDPLLIIAAGPEPGDKSVPGEPRSPQVVRSVADAWTAYRVEWLPKMEQGRGRWILCLRVSDDGVERPGARDAVTNIRLTKIRVPRAARLLLALVLVAAGVAIADRTYEHCGTWYSEPELTREADQCVGLAPDDHFFFGDLDAVDLADDLRDGLRDVEKRIHDTNEAVVNQHPNSYQTVVYLSVLSPENTDGYRWELEQLRGIEIAQNEMRDSHPVRVLLANAGSGMDHGRAAAESIADEKARDPRLLGVLGMGISRKGTREAMIRLSEARIPMIGTFISAAPLAETTTEYYHQVGPTNRRESVIAAYYAKHMLGVTKAHLYFAGDPDDLYSADLRNQVNDAFGAQGIDVEESPYKMAADDAGIDLAQLGRQACELGDDAVAFYAGRAEHLPAFLTGMRNGCEGSYPKIISGDDATRFVLARSLKNYPGLSLDYLSFGSSLAWGADCAAARAKAGFFVGYVDHYGSACVRTRDGSAILAYDSFMVFDQAVKNAPRDDFGLPTTDGVLAGLNTISVDSRGAMRGASGNIDFGKGGHPVPVDKAVMILRATGSAAPRRVLLCGVIWTAQPPADTAKCPAPEVS